ncbi:MAG: hypothetical protein FWC40_02575 [Proteobacteria bacterium]|nr:hypothetical protein [Pseudomonadota bacterium]
MSNKSRFFVLLLKILLCLGACAVVYGERAAAHAQTSGQEYFEQGNRLYNAKKYAEAVASYIKAIQIAPMSQPMAYLNSARAYSMRNDSLQAKRYYEFYLQVVPAAASDRKVMGEYRAVEKKIKKGQTYVRPPAQVSVIAQLEASLKGGPFLTRQGGGAFAYYDVLERTGFAEPSIFDYQKRLVSGLVAEIEREISPLAGQPLPNLDRVGWENVRNKLGRVTQFPDVSVDKAKLERIEHTARGWEAYYRGDYVEAASLFALASREEAPILSAFWGLMMAQFQIASTEAGDVNGIMATIDRTQRVYARNNQGGLEGYFALLKAQAYRNVGDIPKSLEWLSKMQEAN